MRLSGLNRRDLLQLRDCIGRTLQRGSPEILGATSSCNVPFLIEIGAFVLLKTDISGKFVQFAWWALATIVFTLVVAIRIRLLGIPFERDEGEYAYAGQLILQGIPPYKLAYNMKFPGTYAAYALIMSIFGQTIHGIHLGLLLVNVATIALIFLVGRRLINTMAGITGAASYAVLSVSPSVLGLAAHATHFVMLPVLGGILLLLKATASDGFRAVTTKSVRATVRLRIAVWDWRPDEAAWPAVHSLRSNLHCLE